MKILKSILIIAVVISMAVPTYAGIKPSSSAFLADTQSPPPTFTQLLTTIFQYPTI